MSDMKPAGRVFRLDVHSLRFRLPLAISTAIALLLAAFLGVAYREVGQAQVQAAGLRAQGAADQLASALSQGALQRITDTRRAVRTAAVRACLLDRTPDNCRDARATLERLPTPTPQVVDLWNTRGEHLLSITAPPGTDPALPAGSAPSSTGVGPLQVHEGVLFGETVVDIPASDAPRGQGGAPATPTAGFVIIRRPLQAGPTRELLTRLVGTEATIKIGNKAGDIWTDLAVQTAAPLSISRATVSMSTPRRTVSNASACRLTFVIHRG
jgi:hypothetical protein